MKHVKSRKNIGSKNAGRKLRVTVLHSVIGTGDGCEKKIKIGTVASIA